MLHHQNAEIEHFINDILSLHIRLMKIYCYLHFAHTIVLLYLRNISLKNISRPIVSNTMIELYVP